MADVLIRIISCKFSIIWKTHQAVKDKSSVKQPTHKTCFQCKGYYRPLSSRLRSYIIHWTSTDISSFLQRELGRSSVAWKKLTATECSLSDNISDRRHSISTEGIFMNQFVWGTTSSHMWTISSSSKNKWYRSLLQMMAFEQRPACTTKSNLHLALVLWKMVQFRNHVILLWFPNPSKFVI